MTEIETPESIRLTADVVVTTPDGLVLLIERGWEPFAGAWALPGGHVDEGEDGDVAAARELLEETGVRVLPAELSEVRAFHRPGRDPRGRYVTLAYAVTVPAGTQARAGDDATAARWWPVDALPQLAFDHADIISAAVA